MCLPQGGRHGRRKNFGNGLNTNPVTVCVEIELFYALCLLAFASTSQATPAYPDYCAMR